MPNAVSMVNCASAFLSAGPSSAKPLMSTRGLPRIATSWKIYLSIVEKIYRNIRMSWQASTNLIFNSQEPAVYVPPSAKSNSGHPFYLHLTRGRVSEDRAQLVEKLLVQLQNPFHISAEVFGCYPGTEYFNVSFTLVVRSIA